MKRVFGRERKAFRVETDTISDKPPKLDAKVRDVRIHIERGFTVTLVVENGQLKINASQPFDLRPHASNDISLRRRES